MTNQVTYIATASIWRGMPGAGGGDPAHLGAPGAIAPRSTSRKPPGASNRFGDHHG